MPIKNKYSTSKDLAKTLSKKTRLSREEAQKFLEKYFEKISQKLIQGETVRLTEFANFSVTQWNSKEIFDINSNSKVSKDIRTLKFKASEKIKEKIFD